MPSNRAESARRPGADERPRVSLYLPNLVGGGAERTMVALAEGLLRRGVEVDVVLARAHGPYLAELPPEARLVDLRSGGVLASIPRLVRYLRRQRPRAALATLPHASIVLIWANLLAGRPTRVFVREPTTPSAVRPGRLDLRNRSMPWLMRRFYPWAERVVAVSEGVADDLRRFVGLSAEQIVTIYNPVVAPELEVRARGDLQDGWFEPGGPPVVLSVGRLGREKDFATLIHAVALAGEERALRLVILGEGAERARLERLAEELGIADRVRLPGFIANPFPYMARASVYVLSSEREGLPGALIQALACGCPVVSTDCPSGPREVLDGGTYGELVPVGDAQRMASAIIRTLDAPRRSERLRERAGLFSEERSLRAYRELLLGGPPWGAEGPSSGG